MIRERFLFRASAILLTVGLILLYLPFLPQDFLSVDDHDLVLIPQLQLPLSWQSFKSILTIGNHIDYYPLRDISYLVDIHLLGNTPRAFRIHNLVLFLGIIYLFAWNLRLLGVSRLFALLAAFIWGFHPYHIELVTWISARKDLLALMFGLCSSGFFIKAYSSDSGRFYLYSFIALLLGLLTKASLAPLPFIAFMFFLYLRRRPNLKPVVTLMSAAIVCVAYSLFQRWFYAQINDMTMSYSLSQRLMASLAAFGKMNAGWFYPPHNVFDIENWGDWYKLNRAFVPVGLMVWLVILGFSIYGLFKKSVFAAAFCGYLMFYLPVSGLLFPHRNFYSLRYLQPSLLLFSIIALYWLAQKKWRYFLAIPLFIFVTAAFFLDSKNWESNLAIAQKAHIHNPRNPALAAQLYAEIQNEISRRGQTVESELILQRSGVKSLIEKLCQNSDSDALCLQWWYIGFQQGSKDQSDIFAQHLDKMGRKKGAQYIRLRSAIIQKKIPEDKDLKAWLALPYRPTVRARLLAWAIYCFEDSKAIAVNYLKHQQSQLLLAASDIDIFIGDFSQRDRRLKLKECRYRQL